MKQIALEGVSVRFRTVRALEDVSIGIRSGEIIGLVGPNGSGKSTLIRVLLGLVSANKGRLMVDGQPRAVDNPLKRLVGYLPESVAFSENLTGHQMMRFFGHARRIGPAERNATLERIGLTGAANRQIRGYSRGMRQRLGLGLAILHRPQLLILDEPTGGLDQEGLQVLWSVLAEWKEAQRMVLVATHDLTLMEPWFERFCLLKEGRLLACDTPRELRRTAALPIQVTFVLNKTAAVDGFCARLEQQDGSFRLTRNKQEVSAEVAPTDLLKLLQLSSACEHTVRDIRVREPGMDLVYDHLIRKGP